MDSITSNKLASLITQPVLLLAVISLVAVACIATTYQRLATPQSKPPQAFNGQSERKAPKGLTADAIIAMDLFGSSAPIQAEKKNHQDIPETKLKLVLKGAFTHSDPELASALIAKDKGKETELYLVGDELPGNAVLDEVYPSYVVIKRGIQLEKLLFFRNQSEMERQAQGGNARTSAPVQSAVAPPKSQNPEPAPTSVTPNTASPKSLYEIREEMRRKNQ